MDGTQVYLQEWTDGKLHKSFCQNGLLARQADKEVLGRFAEQTHEYHAVIRMVFRKHFSTQGCERYSLFGFEGSNLQNNLHLEN